jgi:hypothetical protein
VALPSQCWFSWDGVLEVLIRLNPGDGFKISFWEEVWCENSSFKEVFPGLYSLASNKEASIADNIDSLSGSR